MTTIYFVRHGEVHNPQGIFFGRYPRFRLSERGRSQAGQTAQFLKDTSIAAIYTSPLLRARQTAQIIGTHHHMQATVSNRLIEIKSHLQGTSS